MKRIKAAAVQIAPDLSGGTGTIERVCDAIGRAAVYGIAEIAANLSQLALRHRLYHLRYLLALVQLEAEEHVRLRSRRRLS